MAYKELEKVKQEAEERGYYVTDMRKVKEKIEQRKHDWIRRFDSYIEAMMFDQGILDSSMVTKIATRASELATLRQELIDEKFKDLPPEED